MTVGIATASADDSRTQVSKTVAAVNDNDGSPVVSSAGLSIATAAADDSIVLIVCNATASADDSRVEVSKTVATVNDNDGRPVVPSAGISIGDSIALTREWCFGGDPMVQAKITDCRICLWPTTNYVRSATCGRGLQTRPERRLQTHTFADPVVCPSRLQNRG